MFRNTYYKVLYLFMYGGRNEPNALYSFAITPWVVSNKMTHRAVLHVGCGACRISYERRNVNFMRGCGV